MSWLAVRLYIAHFKGGKCGRRCLIEITRKTDAAAIVVVVDFKLERLIHIG